jgi:hypothetical protein
LSVLSRIMFSAVFNLLARPLIQSIAVVFQLIL